MLQRVKKGIDVWICFPSNTTSNIDYWYTSSKVTFLFPYVNHLMYLIADVTSFFVLFLGMNETFREITKKKSTHINFLPQLPSNYFHHFLWSVNKDWQSINGSFTKINQSINQSKRRNFTGDTGNIYRQIKNADLWGTSYKFVKRPRKAQNNLSKIGVDSTESPIMELIALHGNKLQTHILQ